MTGGATKTPSEAFIEALPPDASPGWSTHGSAEKLVAQALARGAARWPSLAVDPAQFARYLGQRLGALSPDEAQAAQLEDLLLVCCCVAREPQALEALQTIIAHEVATALRSTHEAKITAAELAQAVSVKLLVAENGGATRLEAFRGVGALAKWVRIVATRLVWDLAEARGDDKAEPLADELLSNAAFDTDPEKSTIKLEQRALFKQAFAAALATLTSRQRNVLRLTYGQGLTAGEVGALYGVHRVSVARWLAEARQEVESAVRAELLARTKDPELAATLLKLSDSYLSLSMPSVSMSQP